MSAEEDTEFNQMIDSFYSREEDYLQDLDTLNHLRLRLLTHNRRDDPILDEDEINQVFLNSGSIFEFNSGLLRRLNRMRWKGEEYFIVHVGGMLVKDIQFFKMYGQFIEHVRTAEHRFKDLCQRNSKFKRFVDFHHDLYKKEFSALLYAPLHHLPQYIQTFGELHQALCAINHPAQESMFDAVNKMQEVMDAISEQAAATKRSNKVVEIQRKLGDRVSLVAASRQAYRHATVKLKDQKQSSSVQTAELVLFNDCIIYFTSGFFGTSLKGVMQVAGLEITPLKSQNNTFRLFNELTQREWEITTLEDREYIPWIANLLQVYKRYYGIFDGNDKRLGPQHSNTLSPKVLHPEDFEAELRNKTINNPRYKEKPSPIIQSSAQELLDERRRDRQAAAMSSEGGAAAAGEIITASQQPLHIPTPASHHHAEEPLTPVGGASAAHAGRPQFQPPRQLSISSNASGPLPAVSRTRGASQSSVRRLSDQEIWDKMDGYQGWARLWDETNAAYYFEHNEDQITQWSAPDFVQQRFDVLRQENDAAVAAAAATATTTAAVAIPTPPAKPSRPVPPTPTSATSGATTVAGTTPSRPAPATPPRRASVLPPVSPTASTTSQPPSQPPRPPKRDAVVPPAVPNTPSLPVRPPAFPTSPSHELPTPAATSTTVQPPAFLPSVSSASHDDTTTPVETPAPTPAPVAQQEAPAAAPVAAVPTTSAPPARPAFLAAIAGGGAPALKKVEAEDTTHQARPAAPAGGLLGAIKGGVTLNKVTDADRNANRGTGGGITLATNLQKSLANYRKFVQDDDDDDDDDDDW